MTQMVIDMENNKIDELSLSERDFHDDFIICQNAYITSISLCSDGGLIWGFPVCIVVMALKKLKFIIFHIESPFLRLSPFKLR